MTIKKSIFSGVKGKGLVKIETVEAVRNSRSGMLRETDNHSFTRGKLQEQRLKAANRGTWRRDLTRKT